jgi:hypothetical protein
VVDGGFGWKGLGDSNETGGTRSPRTWTIPMQKDLAEVVTVYILIFKWSYLRANRHL